MTTAARPMTAEEFLAVSTEGDRMHLVGGVTVVNEATLRHQLLQSELLFEIGRWCREEADRGVVVGPVDVVVGEHDVYGPDLVYLRDPVADPDARLDRLPDLCVEIRSPGTWRFDVGRKKAMYEAAGLPELWLVDDAAESVSSSGAPPRRRRSSTSRSRSPATTRSPRRCCRASRSRCAGCSPPPAGSPRQPPAPRQPARAGSGGKVRSAAIAPST